MTVSTRPQISGDIMYYTAYLLSADPVRFGSDILFKVRKAYFTSGKRQKDKMFLNAQGESIQCFYTMENHRPLKWKKVSEGKLCERARQTGLSGYCVETLDYSDAVTKKCILICSTNGCVRNILTAFIRSRNLRLCRGSTQSKPVWRFIAQSRKRRLSC